MLAKTYSAAVVGIDAFPVEVEIHADQKGANSPSAVSIVGLPDAAVKESRDRVRSALQSSGCPLLQGTTVINLAPADLRKEGAAFDLPIALVYARHVQRSHDLCWRRRGIAGIRLLV